MVLGTTIKLAMKRHWNMVFTATVSGCPGRSPKQKDRQTNDNNMEELSLGNEVLAHHCRLGAGDARGSRQGTDKGTRQVQM